MSLLFSNHAIKLKKLPIKLCKDCKFIKNNLCIFQKFKYNNEENDDNFEYYLSAKSCRKNEMYCGIDAKNFNNFK